MRYLTFDIESSTGCPNDGSLCSFGYYICNENFDFIEQKDLIFNPLASFRYNIIGKNRKVALAYSVKEFKSAERFSAHYNEVKSLFDGADIVFGFAVENDVRYLRDACEKFNLPQIEYKFVDVKQLLELYNDEFKDKGLSAIAEALNIEFIPHRSDEDARVTLLIVKYLCEKHNFTVDELLKYAGIVCGENVSTGFTHMYSLSQLYERNGFVRTGRQTNALLDYAVKTAQKDRALYGVLRKKSVAIAKCIKLENVDRTYNILKAIYSKGGKYAHCVQVANVYVYRQGADDTEYERALALREEGKKITILEEKEFLLILDDLGEDTFDYLKVVKEYDRQRVIKKEALKKNKKQGKVVV